MKLTLRKQIDQIVSDERQEQILEVFDRFVNSKIENNRIKLDKSNKKEGIKREEGHGKDSICLVCTDLILKSLKKEIQK